MRSRLSNAALGCHLVLTATLTIAILVPQITLARLLFAAAVAAPLLATLPGLLRSSRLAQRWLATLLVPYIGGLCVEVVARAGAAPLLGIALLVAVAELGMLFAVSLRPQAAHE